MAQEDVNMVPEMLKGHEHEQRDESEGRIDNNQGRPTYEQLETNWYVFLFCCFLASNFLF